MCIFKIYGLSNIIKAFASSNLTQCNSPLGLIEVSFDLTYRQPVEAGGPTFQKPNNTKKFKNVERTLLKV